MMTGMSEPDPREPSSPAARRDARRAVLAAIAAAQLDDEDGYLAVLGHFEHPVLLLPAALGLLLDTLDERGVDVAEWVAGQQRQLLEAEVRGDGGP
jgi:hypothetical protein